MTVKNITGRHADISKRLRAVREILGFSSQQEFADAIDVSRKSYNQWESGDFRISFDGARNIRLKFGITMDFLFLGITDALPHKIATDLSESPWLKQSSKSTDNPDD